MTWKEAHRAAMMAAAHAHDDYGIARERYVDVFAALRTGGIKFMAQPLGSLFGVYFAPEFNGPGVVVNSSFNETVLRHTAAHELGHHCLRHGSTADESIEVFEDWGVRTWTETEKQAEAFAAWFLMPRRAVLAALAAMGRSHISGPSDAYQVSLWLGTSYRGTVRHLQNLRLIGPKQSAAWSASGPAELRRALDEGAANESVRHWDLGPAADGSDLHVRGGDRLTICTEDAEAKADILPAGLSYTPTARSRDKHMLEVGNDLTARTSLSIGKWQVALLPTPNRRGLATD